MRPFAVCVGLPGSGKSTMARGLANRLGLDVKDSDDLIVASENRTIPEIFERDGEAGFRAIEARVITEALQSFDGVLSLGGGAIETPAVRRALRGHRVVNIEADFDVLLERVTRHPAKRPLLADDPEGGLRRLSEKRGPLYQQVATCHVRSGVNDPEETVDRMVNALGDDTRIDVGDYTVVVGRGLEGQIAQCAAGASAVVLVHPEALTTDAQRIEREMVKRGLVVHHHIVPDGESQKCVDVLSGAWDALGELKIGRDGLIVGIGGGATTDLAGFIAATWLRGVSLIQVPTSLLGMVDAAVGGKTGIDTAAGKNLVGAFYKPDGVFADLNSLSSLPERELKAGLGEVIKCGWIDDAAILDHNGADLLHVGPALEDAIRRSIAVKARIVTEDFTEQGKREFLNFGHTLAHAIEKIENYQIRHGEAVAIGSVYAAELGERLGVTKPGVAQRVRASFEAVGLPVTFRQGRRGELVDAMYSDKKVRAGRLRFVVLGPNGPEMVSPDREIVMDCVARIEC